jgi:hypothetical protein
MAYRLLACMGKAAQTTAQELKAGKNESIDGKRKGKIGIGSKKSFITVIVILYLTIINKDFNMQSCTGIYHEMRALEGGEPAEPTVMTAEEKEELL